MASEARMHANALLSYFNRKYGNLGIDQANDLLKALEKIPAASITPPIYAIKSDLADIVMLGSSTCAD